MDAHLTVALLFACVSLSCSSSESALFKRWSEDDFSSDARPVLNSSMPISVDVGLSIYHIIDFNPDTMVADINGLIHLKWTDETRVWSPEEYGGIDKVSVSSANLWTPDIAIFNSLTDPMAVHSMEGTRVSISNDGSAYFAPQYRWSVVCHKTVDAMKPNCELKVGSSSMDSKQMNLQISSNRIDVSSYFRNPQWELLKTKAERYERLFSCCVNSFLHVIFSFKLSRRPDADGDDDEANGSTLLTALSLSTMLGAALLPFILKR